MGSCSAALADWLDEILAAEDEPDPDAQARDTLRPDDRTVGGVRVIWYFPTSEVSEEYLSTIDSRSEDEVRKVIGRFLIPSVALDSDYVLYWSWLNLPPKEDCLDEHMLSYLAGLQESDHVKRVERWFSGASKDPPWQGLKWVLELLPSWPRLALNAIQAYVIAHAPYLGDAMYDALHDAQAVIRARYIGIPESTAERVRLLLELNFREFEQIVEHLYSWMGYETQLTPPSRDGGRDIIAVSSAAGKREHLLIECKRYQGKLGMETVRALQGVVSMELASKGVLVTTAQFTRGAHKLEIRDHRIELINGPQLVLLLNEHLGHSWPARIDQLARRRPVLEPDLGSPERARRPRNDLRGRWIVPSSRLSSGKEAEQFRRARFRRRNHSETFFSHPAAPAVEILAHPGTLDASTGRPLLPLSVT